MPFPFSVPRRILADQNCYTYKHTNVPLSWNLSVLYSTRIYFIPASTESLTVAQKFPDCKNSEYAVLNTMKRLHWPTWREWPLWHSYILLVTNHYQGLVAQFAPISTPSIWCKRPPLWQATNKKGMSIMAKVPHILLAAFFSRDSPRLSRPGCTRLDSEYVVQETTIIWQVLWLAH